MSGMSDLRWLASVAAMLVGAAVGCSSGEGDPPPPSATEDEAASAEPTSDVGATPGSREDSPKTERPSTPAQPALDGEIETCSTPNERRSCVLPASSPCKGPDGGFISEGLQRCEASASGAVWGACACVFEVPIPQPARDCVRISCPAHAPYPIGCAVEFAGDDSRGCVATGSSASELFVKEGNSCGSGGARGAIYCAPTPGPALDAATCPMNKRDPRYVSAPGKCPD